MTTFSHIVSKQTRQKVTFRLLLKKETRKNQLPLTASGMIRKKQQSLLIQKLIIQYRFFAVHSCYSHRTGGNRFLKLLFSFRNLANCTSTYWRRVYYSRRYAQLMFETVLLHVEAKQVVRSLSDGIFRRV